MAGNVPSMATDFTLINAALTRVGAAPLTELNDGTPGGQIAGANYAGFRRTMLTVYPWRWATKTQVLVAIDGDPYSPWTDAYQLPTDILRIRSVTVDGETIDYERQFNKLLCDSGTDADVILKYTWDVPETYWPSGFAEAVTQFLEAMFLRGIGERYQEAKDRREDARITLLAAKLEDSQGSQSPRNPTTSPTLQARGGYLSTTTTIPWR